MDAIRDERDGNVWQQVIEGLTYLDGVFAGTSAQTTVRVYGRSLLVPVLQRLGWRPGESDDAGTLRIRNSLIDTLGRFDDSDTNQRASALFAASVSTAAVPIDPSIRSAVVRTAARSADPATFEILRRLLRDTTTQEDNFHFGGALILVRDPRLVYRILEIALTDEWPPGSASYYLRNVGAASGHPMLARDFILKNFDQVLSKASIRGRPWVLPDAYRGFNELREADNLLAVQRRLLGRNCDESGRAGF